MNQLPFWTIMAASAAVCLATILLFPRLKALHARRADEKAVQAMHRAPTPRLGGVAILAAAAIWGLMAPESIRVTVLVLLVAMLPVAVAGLMEDLGYRVSPAGRLVAAVASGGMAIALSGYWVRAFGIPGLDAALAVAPVGIAATLFATATITHSFNLIDGLNGLAGGLAAMIAIGLMVVGQQAGAGDLAFVKAMLLASVAGFLLFNFPFGKIFLGDAGAYALGFLLAWSAILLAAKAPGVSAAALVLMFFWPLADLVLAMVRRRRRARDMTQPDRLHFHQLVMRALELSLLGRGRRHWANPLASAIVLVMAAMPVVAGVLLWDDPAGALAAMALFALAFHFAYVLGVWLATRRFYGRVPELLRLAAERDARALSRGRS